MKRLLTVSAAIVALAAMPAQAAVSIDAGAAGSQTLTNVNDSFSFNFNGQVPNGPVIPGLGALLTLTYKGFTTGGGNTVYDFLYSLENTSTLAGTRVSAFGFLVDPNATAATVNGSYTTALVAPASGAQFPSNIAVDVCVTGNNNCNGGGNGGIDFGQTGSGHLFLTFAGTVANITMSDFIDRYQAFSYNGINSAIGTPVGVPEPAGWMLMILGIGAVGAVMRRRQAVAAKINFA